MKQLSLILICFFPLLAASMDMPQQVSFLNGTDSITNDIRREHLYPVLCIQDLGRLA